MSQLVQCPKCGGRAYLFDWGIRCGECGYDGSDAQVQSLPASSNELSRGFDPYYTWLGIPPSRQPPNHYQLLGITNLEQNSDVISHAADRQMSHLRSFAIGPHSKFSQQLLNEIATARICLLKPTTKAAYDATLVRQGSERAPAVPPPAMIPEQLAASEREGYRPTPRRQSPSVRRATPTPNVLRTLIIVFGGVIGVGIALGLLSLIREQEAERAREDLAQRTRKQGTEVQPQSSMAPRESSQPNPQTQTLPPKSPNASKEFPKPPAQPFLIPDEAKEPEVPFARNENSGGRGISAAKDDNFIPSNVDPSVGTAVIDYPHGEVVFENVPEFVVGKGEPKSDSMWYTVKSAKPADGRHIVTIHNTPLGDCVVDVKVEMKGWGSNSGIGIGTYPVDPKLPDLEMPHVEVNWYEGEIRSVSWGGKSVGPTKPDPGEREAIGRPSNRVATLIAQLDDPSPDKRIAAANELANIGPAAHDSVTPLEKSLDDVSSKVQAAAIRALASIGRDAKQAVPRLAKVFFDHDDNTVRELSVRALIDIDPTSTELRKILTKLIVGSRGDIPRPTMDAAVIQSRIWACQALGEIGSDASWSTPMLVQLLKISADTLNHDPNRRLFLETAQAMGMIGDPRALPALKDYAKGQGLKPQERAEEAMVAADTASRRIKDILDNATKESATLGEDANASTENGSTPNELNAAP